MSLSFSLVPHFSLQTCLPPCPCMVKTVRRQLSDGDALTRNATVQKRVRPLAFTPSFKDRAPSYTSCTTTHPTAVHWCFRLSPFCFATLPSTVQRGTCPLGARSTAVCHSMRSRTSQRCTANAPAANLRATGLTPQLVSRKWSAILRGTLPPASAAVKLRCLTVDMN